MPIIPSPGRQKYVTHLSPGRLIQSGMPRGTLFAVRSTRGCDLTGLSGWDDDGGESGGEAKEYYLCRFMSIVVMPAGVSPRNWS